jgi:hypothetical protein
MRRIRNAKKRQWIKELPMAIRTKNAKGRFTGMTIDGEAVAMKVVLRSPTKEQCESVGGGIVIGGRTLAECRAVRFACSGLMQWKAAIVGPKASRKSRVANT